MNLASVILADAERHPSRLALAGDFGPVGLGDLADRVRIAASVLAAEGVRPGDVVALALPDRPSWIAAFPALARLGAVAALATSYGLGNSLYFPLGVGATAWIGGDRDPTSAARACRESGVTAIYGVPTFWARVARHVDEGRVHARDFAGVRLAVSAGEHLPEAVWHAVRRTTGQVLSVSGGVTM